VDAFYRKCAVSRLHKAGGAQQPFIIKAGDHILKIAVVEILSHPGIKRLEPRGEENGSHVYVHFLGFLAEINGAVLADAFADAAFLLFKVDAAFVNIRDKRDCLGIVDVNGFVLISPG